MKEYKHVTIEIEQDDDAIAPDDCGDESLFLIADHRDFFVPPSPKVRNFDIQAEIDERKHDYWIFGLEAYVHSGVRLALSHEGNFPDRQWDVSQLGVVFVSKKEWRLRKSARKAALSLISEWNTYLSGDVWGYTVKNEDDEILDSCWGIGGREYAEEAAEEVADYHEKEIQAEQDLINSRLETVCAQERTKNVQPNLYVV